MRVVVVAAALGPVLDVEQAALADGGVDGVEDRFGRRQALAGGDGRRRGAARAAQLLGGAAQRRAVLDGQLPAEDLDGQQQRVDLQRRQARRPREGRAGDVAGHDQRRRP